MSTAAFKVPSVQYAALPWRRSKDHLQILLVTTLTTGRWIVPKGWPLPGLAPAQCAAQEAAEEAGVVGDVGPRPLGTFQYEKRRKSGEALQCRVEVFAMEVQSRRRNWPEKSVRQARWCSVEDALERVSDPGLRRIIAKFAKAACDDTRQSERPAIA